MTVWEKLQAKPGVDWVVICCPEEARGIFAQPLAGVSFDVPNADFQGAYLAFVTQLIEVETWASGFAEKTLGDVDVWLAYPKQSSKKYKCEFNRDTGWASLAAVGFLPVRQISIDEDWSALRFRRREYIKKLTRQF